MTDLIRLKDANERRWNAAKLTRGPEFLPVAKRLVAAKQRYLTVQAKTGVPWVFIAVTHQRESSQNWASSIAQGDNWNEVSTHVPKGRGPFKSWEEAAIDALVNCGPYAARNKDWSIGGMLTLLERYNGLAYANAGRPSPYIWSGTDQYVRGKVLVDHGPIEDVYPSGPRKGQPVVDLQLGCAGLIMAMMALDPTITFTGAAITQNTTLPPMPGSDPGIAPPPSITNPSKGSIGAFIASIFAAIFKRN